MPQTSPSPDLVASVVICKNLGINRSTLTRWVESGKATPAMKLPGKRGAYLFTPAEADRLAELWATKAPA